MKLTNLIHLGLTEKEARIYLACLELGYASLQGMARKAGTNRSSAYIIVERLKAKNLILETYKGKRKVYMAANPKQLRKLLTEKITAIHEEEKKFDQDFLPELKSIHNKAEGKPRVRYYDIKEGLEVFRDEILNSKDKVIYALTPLSKIPEKYRSPKVFRDQIQKKGKVFKETIISRSKKDLIDRIKQDKRLKEGIKEIIISEDGKSVDCEIHVNGNSLYLMQFSDKPFVVVIENGHISRAIKYLIKRSQKS